MTAAAVAEQEDRAEWHLWNWSVWHGRRTNSLGYPSRGMGGLGCSGSSDFDSMCANADNRCALAVDTIVDDLPPRERAALYNRWIVSVFRFRDGEDMAYKTAKSKLGKRLWAKGIW